MNIKRKISENKCPFLAKSVSAAALTLIVSWTIIAGAAYCNTPIYQQVGERHSIKPPLSNIYTRSQQLK